MTALWNSLVELIKDKTGVGSLDLGDGIQEGFKQFAREASQTRTATSDIHLSCE